ncbi:aspartate carbamoyltransferase [Patescibacteria group bacterium]|nr:MAG: aspartate carbamoyltransferase [Patescibacteria group bacterium]
MDHVLSVDQFDRAALEDLFKRTDAMRELVKKDGGDERLAHHVSANLFYEPSTRTNSSFTAAMYRLGGGVININDMAKTSAAKGETLEDTVRMLAGYADVIVIRHSEVGAMARAAAVSSVPIISGGEGVGEHPTQALLDLYTIYQEKGTIDGLNITMLGDLKYGRTPHSLAKILNNFDVSINFVAPASLAFPEELKALLKNKVSTATSLADVLPDSDVIYATRIQKERIDDPTEYEQIGDSYHITKDTLTKMKQDAIVMHPLPRVDEVTTDVDSDPRAAYFRQAENGLYVRMALFDMLIKH